MKARTRARKRAVDLLYEADLRGLNRNETDPTTSLEAVIVEVLKERLAYPGHEAPLPQYAVDAAEGISAHLTHIDEAISTYSHGWTLGRMPAVDRAILRLGTWEIMYNDEVPDAVAIDEAVAMATRISTDDSPAFINGLLDRIKTMKP